MAGILLDINIQGHLEFVVSIWQSPYWQEIWDHLGLAVFRFADVGLEQEAADSAVWRLCQERELILITANRNKDGVDSLEATIRRENTVRSLPVITVGDVERLQRQRSYADLTAERILEYLLVLDDYRGAGRLYAP
jgi:hypothetical protein